MLTVKPSSDFNLNFGVRIKAGWEGFTVRIGDLMQTVTIYKGLPGSGKTTKAKEIVAASEGKIKRINKRLIVRIELDHLLCRGPCFIYLP